MNTVVNPGQPASGAVGKSLWAAVGALSVVVIALGATLVYVQTRPAEPLTAVLDAEKQAATVPAVTDAPGNKTGETPSVAKPAPAKSALATNKPSVHRTDKPVFPAQKAAAPEGHSGALPARATAAGPATATQPVANPLCINCGTVIAMTAVQREGTGSGLGVVAGGVLGALAGNQVGDGSGRTAATILGAVGGGWAGNTVEKKMKKETVYQIQLRMDDGSTRTMEQMTPVAVGSKVTIEGGALRLPDGSLSTPVPVKPPPSQPSTSPTPTAG